MNHKGEVFFSNFPPILHQILISTEREGDMIFAREGKPGAHPRVHLRWALNLVALKIGVEDDLI